MTETNWTCPTCHGGFPSLDEGCCPWCGEAADGEHDKPGAFRTRVSRIETRDRDDGDDGPIRRLFR